MFHLPVSRVPFPVEPPTRNKLTHAPPSSAVLSATQYPRGLIVGPEQARVRASLGARRGTRGNADGGNGHSTFDTQEAGHGASPTARLTCGLALPLQCLLTCRFPVVLLARVTRCEHPRACACFLLVANARAFPIWAFQQHHTILRQRAVPLSLCVLTRLFLLDDTARLLV